jgi:hypothetical protein
LLAFKVEPLLSVFSHWLRARTGRERNHIPVEKKK